MLEANVEGYLEAYSTHVVNRSATSACTHLPYTHIDNFTTHAYLFTHVLEHCTSRSVEESLTVGSCEAHIARTGPTIVTDLQKGG